MEEEESMSAIATTEATPGTLVSYDAEKVRKRFRALLPKANKENPRAADVLALIDLLYKNKEMKLWRDVVGMGELAESQVLDTILGNGKSGQGSRACWRKD
jgi:hypothetical protein